MILVADMNHNNPVDFGKIAKAGIGGVIHKAVQGDFTDGAYAQRRAIAKVHDLEWGAYAFNTADDVASQVAHFFAVAQPDERTSMWLDFEDNPHSPMSEEQARQFLGLVDSKLGRYCGIYGGNRIKELLPKFDAFFAKHPLWLCEYGPVARLPASWSKYDLWQFTGDGVGPGPHTVDGLEQGADLSRFEGTRAELAAWWPLPAVAS